jgi:hypothetical protein
MKLNKDSIYMDSAFYFRLPKAMIQAIKEAAMRKMMTQSCWVRVALPPNRVNCSAADTKSWMTVATHPLGFSAP